MILTGPNSVQRVRSSSPLRLSAGAFSRSMRSSTRSTKSCHAWCDHRPRPLGHGGLEQLDVAAFSGDSVPRRGILSCLHGSLLLSCDKSVSHAFFAGARKLIAVRATSCSFTSVRRSAPGLRSSVVTPLRVLQRDRWIFPTASRASLTHDPSRAILVIPERLEE